MSTIAIVIDNEIYGYFLAERPPRIVKGLLQFAVITIGWTVPVYIEADRVSLVRPS